MVGLHLIFLHTLLQEFLYFVHPNQLIWTSFKGLSMSVNSILCSLYVLRFSFRHNVFKDNVNMSGNMIIMCEISSVVP